MWRVEQYRQSVDFAVRIGGRDVKSVFRMGELDVEYVHFLGGFAPHGLCIEYVRG
jgi:hypothetical protein